MAGLRHPDRDWIGNIGAKGSESLVWNGAFSHSATLSVSGQRRDSNPRYPFGYNIAKELSPTAPNTSFCFRGGATVARPAGAALPIAAPCLAAALRESNPRPHLIWSEGRPGYGTHPETCIIGLFRKFRATGGWRVNRSRSRGGGVEPILLLPKKQLSTNEVSPAYGT